MYLFLMYLFNCIFLIVSFIVIGTPAKTSTSPASGDNDDSKAYLSVVLKEMATEATWDVKTYPEDQETPAPFLIWGASAVACASSLIKRLVFSFYVLFDVCFLSHLLLTNIKWDIK